MSTATVNEKSLERLCDAVLSLKTAADVERFLRDVCTLSELKALSDRLQVAERVQKNEPYRSISTATGASTATVTRVAHWFHHGTGGYKLVLDRMK